MLKEIFKKCKEAITKTTFTILQTEVNRTKSNIKNLLLLGFWDADGFYFNREGYDKHGKNYF